MITKNLLKNQQVYLKANIPNTPMSSSVKALPVSFSSDQRTTIPLNFKVVILDNYPPYYKDKQHF